MFAGRGEGSSKGARSRQACRDRCPQTADAGIYDGMGDDSPGFCRREVTERGRMEFSRDESRAITESGSGHENKILQKNRASAKKGKPD